MGEYDAGDSGHMRAHLLRLFESRPFQPFLVRLEGGYDVRVVSTEFVDFDRGVQVIAVTDSQDQTEWFETTRIVSLKTID